MHLWATSKLADQIASGEVPPREKITYFVFAAVFVIAAGYAAEWGPSDRSWLHAYEGVVVCVVTLTGAHRVASSY
jgi:hypothetical protein